MGVRTSSYELEGGDTIEFTTHDVTKHAWVKVALEVQDRPVNFKIADYKKFMNVVSDSHIVTNL